MNIINRDSRKGFRLSCVGAAIAVVTLHVSAAGASTVSQVPLTVTQEVPPIVMLNLSNDHQLYFEAYNDYTDLTGDGIPNTTYTHSVDYYGYFDSYKCYDYVAASGRFVPQAKTTTKYCNSVSGSWSGNFLNWLTMARIDTVRRMLFGGYRHIDTATTTVLERTYLPNDAHSWARYYAGSDLGKLAPISDTQWRQTPIESSVSDLTVDVGQLTMEIADSDDVWITHVTFGSDFSGRPGDQIWLKNGDRQLQGYLTRERDSGNRWRVVFNWATGEGTVSEWDVVNRSRVGVTFCNTTQGGSALSQNVTAPPLLRVAQGNYTLWGANERWQCKWGEERNNTLAGSGFMPTNRTPNSNGNVAAVTGIEANTDNPNLSEDGIGAGDYHVRVEVCREGLREDNCARYGDDDESWKPVGLLQRFSGSGGVEIDFGLMTGSYERNKSGGVLRKRAGGISNEINPDDGTFIEDGPSIIGSLSRLRIYGYRHDVGTYHGANDSDGCVWGQTSFNEGECSNWGNPQSELFLESLRYLAGAESPIYHADDSSRISGLLTDSWNDPIPEARWCSALNVIQFNASTNSYDGDAGANVGDIGMGSLATWTNAVGSGEGIHGNQYFVGEAGANADQICTGKNVNQLYEVSGICPDEPRLGGTYHIAGLAYFAHQTDLRPDREGTQTVTTHGVELAPAVPEITIPGSDGNKRAAILPACREYRTGRTPAFGNCSIVDFRTVYQEQTATGSRGHFFVQWEDSEQGGDYDMDMSGVLSYELDGNQLHVSTRTFSDSSDGQMGFGYVLSGTTNDGFHVHSGINGYSERDCANLDCRVMAPATSKQFNLGGGTATNLERPLFYAAKWGGFEDKNDSGQPDLEEEWDSTGDGTPDNYHFATNPQALEKALEETLVGISDTIGSAASVATNSTRLDADTMVYQARFNTVDWSGELLAFPLDPTTGELEPAAWDAGEMIQNFGRQIVTWDPDDNMGISFVWNELTDTQQAHLNTDPATGALDDLGQRRLEWLRGDQSCEIENLDAAHCGEARFRDRDTLLADIVHSGPAFVGSQDFDYYLLAETTHHPYVEFLGDKIGGRPPMLYVGANDGKVHGFDAVTGEERFAYVPNSVFGKLSHLPAPDYGDNHQFLVDESPRHNHAFVGGEWRHVLVGSLGAGGAGIYALDVTDPTSMGPGNVLWELDGSDLTDLGYTIGSPTIARTRVSTDGEFFDPDPAAEDPGRWVAVFGNGYNSASGKAMIYVVDMEDGSLIRSFDTEAGPDNGMSAPLPLDLSGDRITDLIVAGDLKGNLWRIDVRDPNPDNWDFLDGNNSGPLPMFRTGGRPITVRPQVTAADGGKHMYLFGSGQYFRVGDNDVGSNPPIDSFYGVIAPGTNSNPGGIGNDNNVLERDDLLEQEILAELDFEEFHVRVTTDHEMNNEDGWYIDLVSPGDDGGPAGERVISDPVVRGDRVIFTTVIPSDDPCSAGGTSWLMEMDVRSGARLDYSPFDLDGDGEFDEGDYVTVELEDGSTITVPVSGMRSRVGVIRTPGIISAGDTEYKYVAGSSGEMERIVERGGIPEGRQSWRQMR